jgi:hypothetical protein
LRAVAALKAELESWRVSLFSDRIHVVDGDVSVATGRLGPAGPTASILEMTEQDPSLEDVFLIIAEQGARHGLMRRIIARSTRDSPSWCATRAGPASSCRWSSSSLRPAIAPSASMSSGSRSTLSRQYADVFRNSLTFRVVTLPPAMSPGGC